MFSILLKVKVYFIYRVNDCMVFNAHRILDVVGRVVESIPIPENETEVIIPLRSFAVSVREIEPESFTGLTFSALLGDSFDFSQNDDSIDASLLVFEEQKTQPTASITIPEDIFGSLVTSSRNINMTVPRRIVHSIYLTDSLFSRREESEFQVGSIVISAAISGGVKVEGLENPIMIQFIKSPVSVVLIFIDCHDGSFCTGCCKWN